MEVLGGGNQLKEIELGGVKDVAIGVLVPLLPSQHTGSKPLPAHVGATPIIPASPSQWGKGTVAEPSGTGVLPPCRLFLSGSRHSDYLTNNLGEKRTNRGTQC